MDRAWTRSSQGHRVLALTPTSPPQADGVSDQVERKAEHREQMHHRDCDHCHDQRPGHDVYGEAAKFSDRVRPKLDKPEGDGRSENQQCQQRQPTGSPGHAEYRILSGHHGASAALPRSRRHSTYARPVPIRRPGWERASEWLRRATSPCGGRSPRTGRGRSGRRRSSGPRGARSRSRRPTPAGASRTTRSG